MSIMICLGVNLTGSLSTYWGHIVFSGLEKHKTFSWIIILYVNNIFIVTKILKSRKSINKTCDLKLLYNKPIKYITFLKYWLWIIFSLWLLAESSLNVWVQQSKKSLHTYVTGKHNLNKNEKTPTHRLAYVTRHRVDRHIISRVSFPVNLSDGFI